MRRTVISPWLLRIPCWLLVTAFLFKVSSIWYSPVPADLHEGIMMNGQNVDAAAAAAAAASAVVPPERDDDVSYDFVDVEDPVIRSQRCDACRLVGRRFDAAFELAEENLLSDGTRDELDVSEVGAVVAHVCSKRRMADVAPMVWRAQRRLGAKGLETWVRLQRSPGLVEPDSVDWPQRVRNHCRFLAEKLEGDIIYDMWLRTSANQPDIFESFLCYGDGVFADCNEWISPDQSWPAGDLEEEEEEGDGEEEEEQEIEEGEKEDPRDSDKTTATQEQLQREADEEPDFLKGLDEAIDRVAAEAVNAST